MSYYITEGVHTHRGMTYTAVATKGLPLAGSAWYADGVGFLPIRLEDGRWLVVANSLYDNEFPDTGPFDTLEAALAYCALTDNT